MAKLDIGEMTIPPDARAHIHLNPGTQISFKSAQVEVCRAEAKGTGEIPEFLLDYDD